MDFIKGNNRDQLVFSTLEMQIEQDNPVRFIDAFVEHLELSQLGFVVSALKTVGRLEFELKLFLKICLYGYMNEASKIKWFNIIFLFFQNKNNPD